MAPPTSGRWHFHGAWRVQVALRWTPLPGALPNWSLTLHARATRVPSADAALRSARRLLERGDGARGLAAGLLERLGAKREVVISDRFGRCSWRGGDQGALRRAARSAAGWGPGPPPKSPAPSRGDARTAGSALSAAQRRVVEHPGGPALVVAVAGAGKTSTMVARVAALVAAGTPPRRVLVTSFSRAAVADVRAKLRSRGDAALEQVEVRTFHSLAYALLREAEAERSRPPGAVPSPPPERVARRVLELTLRRLRERGHPLAAAAGELDADAFLAYRAGCMARLALSDADALALPPAARRRVLQPPVDPEHTLHRPLLAAYERERRALGWRDYDDLVVDAWVLLAGDPARRARISRRWTQRIVDECQDVNPAQVALLEALLDGSGEVMLIGDDDQSIYGFRGSDPSLMFELGARIGARSYVLDRNYRSRPEPLAAAAGLLQTSHVRAPKRLRAARARGGTLTLDAAEGPEQEAARAVERLRDAHEAGFGWHQQALLLRTFAQAPALELALLRADVPYRLVGAPDAFTHPVCRAALAALHLAAVPHAPVSVRARAWLQWLRGLGLAVPAARELAALAAATGSGDAAALTRLERRPGAETGRVRSATDALRVAATQGAAAALRAAEQALLPWPRYGRDAAALQVLRTALAEGLLAPPDASVGELLERIASRRTRSAAASDRVLLTSVHRSKGLEWDVVVVPGQSLGVFPQREDSEERRLAYVAWTRARERLHLVRDATAPPSPFLTDAGVAELIELLSDLSWCDAGFAPTSAAASWARADAARRFDGEPEGTVDPRARTAQDLGCRHAGREEPRWHGSRSRTRAAKGTPDASATSSPPPSAAMGTSSPSATSGTPRRVPRSPPPTQWCWPARSTAADCKRE